MIVPLIVCEDVPLLQLRSRQMEENGHLNSKSPHVPREAVGPSVHISAIMKKKKHHQRVDINKCVKESMTPNQPQ